MARARPERQPALLMLVMLPFWTSFLLRVYAWKGLLSPRTAGWPTCIIGLGLDQLLLAAGLIAAPGKLMNTPFSLVLGMTYTYLPFMILPLYGNLAKMDLRLLEAAADLGATPWVAFWKVTVPLSKAGIIAGSMLVFIPCVGEFVIPELLGGPETLMIGRVVWDEFFSNNDWPMASAVAVVMVLLIIVPLALFNKYQAEAQEAGRSAARDEGARSPSRRAARWFAVCPWLAEPGYVFLYLPIVALVVFSFNDSPLPNVWRGFTLKWYASAGEGPRDAGRPVAEPEDRVLHRLRVGGAGHAGRLRAGQVPALHRPHAVLGHGQCAAGDARGGGRPVAAADAGVHPAGASASPSAACSPSGWATCCWAWPTPRWWSRRACRT
jgi:ABC-type spermidine/putrescine transport system permease subunit I